MEVRIERVRVVEGWNEGTGSSAREGFGLFWTTPWKFVVIAEALESLWAEWLEMVFDHRDMVRCSNR